MDRILTETLAPIRADIQVMKDDIQVMNDDIQDIKRVQGRVWTLAAKNYNLSAGRGHNAGFEVVPFITGQDPTRGPHNLPPLTCVRDVRQLNAQQRDKYYKGYYSTDQLPPVQERTEKILLAIGANA